MYMELQGRKSSHAGLVLLYSKDPSSSSSSSSHLHDSSHPLRAGRFSLKTQDLLGPLEKKRPVEGDSDVSAGPTTTAEAAAEHVLPGGIGTYTITHVALPRPCSSAGAERTCGVARGDSTEQKPVAYYQGPRSVDAAGPITPIWVDPPGPGPTGWWPLPFAGTTNTTNSSTFLPSPKGLLPSPESKKRVAMESVRKSSRGFHDEDDEDDDEVSLREGSASRVDMSVKMQDGKGSDQKQPTTPRSKHSATEQRRRSKINDRFQILRDLLPHNDQKRDKASFLLEVIEYIKFLQEKSQKYEAFPGWNQENAKLIPWKLPQDNTLDHPDAIKNGNSGAGYVFSGRFDDNSLPLSPTMLSNAPEPTESELSAGVSYKMVETPGFPTKEAAVPTSVATTLYDSMASQAQWFRSPFPGDSTVNSAILNEEEELTIDEGTVSVSSAYSQELMTTLTQSLQSSGIDLSQASISVQINLGKRAHRRPAANTTTPNAKDHDDPSSGARAMGHSSVGSSGEESRKARKRHKSESS